MHHGGLHKAYRQAVEMLFRSKTLQVGRYRLYRQYEVCLLARFRACAPCLVACVAALSLVGTVLIDLDVGAAQLLFPSVACM